MWKEPTVLKKKEQFLSLTISKGGKEGRGAELQDSSCKSKNINSILKLGFGGVVELGEDKQRCTEVQQDLVQKELIRNWTNGTFETKPVN